MLKTIPTTLAAGLSAMLLAAALPLPVAAAVGPTLAETHDLASDDTWDQDVEIDVSLADGGSVGGDGVTVEGDVVTITDPGTYRLRGTLADGSVIVDSEQDGVVRLILDGVDVASSTGAAIAVLQADKTVIWLAEGSDNSLTDATEYVFADTEEDEPNAALFSKDDLTIAGAGGLTVDANYNDGIASKDGLIIAGGNITVDAADDGVRGKDYLVITGGSLTVDAGGDALKSDEEDDADLGYISIDGGSMDLTAGSDAIEAYTAVVISGGELAIAADDDAIHSEAWLEISDGDIDISRSYEGLEGTMIVVSGGDIDIVADDDGLNVAGGDASSASQGGPRGGGGGEMAIDGYFAEISGGTIVIDAGGDGLDSNGSANVTGGTIVINGPTSSGNGAIDVNGTMLVSGGTLVAAGSAGMAEMPSTDSEQALLGIAFGSTLPAGTTVHIQANDGTAILTWESSKPFETLVVSTPELVAGASYDVLLDGQAAGDSVGGLYLDATSSGGTAAGTLNAS